MVTEFFLENLKQLMKLNGVESFNELSRLSGISQSTMSNWGIRKNIPGAENLEILARFFKVAPHYFFMEPGTQARVDELKDASEWIILFDFIADNYFREDHRVEWYRDGGPNRYARLLRQNHETDSFAYPNWFIEMNKWVYTYVASSQIENIIEKIRNRSK